MRLVLIEDEPDCYEAYQDLLEAHGHNVTVYDEADLVVRDMANVCSASVVVLDLMIQLGSEISPNEGSETGIAIYRRIRQVAKDLRIVVLTARSQAEIWTSFQDDTHVRYLGKPVSSVEKFYAAIEEW